MNLAAYWETKDRECQVWLRDNDKLNTPESDEARIATLSVVEAIRLRDGLTRIIEHCVEANLKEAEKDLAERKKQKDRV